MKINDGELSHGRLNSLVASSESSKVLLLWG